MIDTGTQARTQKLARCMHCGQISYLPDAHHDYQCPRCHEPLSFRIPGSIHKTWALVITAAILYIPANTFPVMTVISFGRGHPDTIFSGIVYLVQAGMYPIAFLVFFASIIVPLFKLIGLTILLLSIQFRWQINMRQATVMYRFIHFIGRWSMLDLFMISILVTLVNLGSIATIATGAGSTAFASVVVLTMLAAHTFDPRLIWDLLEDSPERLNGPEPGNSPERETTALSETIAPND